MASPAKLGSPIVRLPPSVSATRRCFNRPDFNLQTACPGTFALMPVEGMLTALRRDYEAMAGMIIGPAPRFEDVLRSIADIESHLNRAG